MTEPRSRMSFVFRPQGAEKDLSLLTRGALAMQGANSITPISADTHPELKNMLDEVSARAGMAAPRAYVWHSVKPVANAVAISGGAPTVAFSEDIIKLLGTEELTAVAAHELGHVKNMNHSGKLGMLAGIGGAAAAWVATRPLNNAMHHKMAKDMMNGKTSSPGGQAIGFVKDMAIFTGAMAGSALASRSEELAADRYGAMLMQGDGTPLMSGLQKLGEFNEQHYRPTLLSKIMKPYSRLTSSHPHFDQRRESLGVSKEDIASYRAVNNVQHAAATPQPEAAVAVEAPVQNEWQTRMAEAAERSPASHSR